MLCRLPFGKAMPFAASSISLEATPPQLINRRHSLTSSINSTERHSLFRTEGGKPRHLMARAVARTALNLDVANASPHSVSSASQRQNGRHLSLLCLATHFIRHKWIVIKVILIDPKLRISWARNIGVDVLWISALRI